MARRVLTRYRVIYRIHDRVVEVHLVGPRKDIYEVLRRALARSPQD